MAVTRRSLKGLALQVVGFVFIAVAAACEVTAAALVSWFGVVRDQLVLGALIAIVLAAGSIPLFRYGKRLPARGRRYLSSPILTAAEVIETDYVLYLRSFAQDGRQRMQLERDDGAHVIEALPFSMRTQEEQIAAAVRPIGRMIAVGRPGETLPHAGASRLYLPPTDWQDTVSALMGHARLTLIVFQETPSMVWELTHAVSALRPGRLMVIAEDRLASVRLRSVLGALPTPITLPDELPENHRFGGSGWAITFRPDWSVEVTELSMPTDGHVGQRAQTEKAIRRIVRAKFGEVGQATST